MSSIAKKLALALVIFLSVQPRPFAIETSSGSYSMDILSIANIGGGGSMSSANFLVPLSTLGEIFTVGHNLESRATGENSDLVVGQVPLLSSELGTQTLYIGELKARTDVLGDFIEEKAWTKDTDPYFYWQVLVEPNAMVEGFSYSLDVPPELIINTTEQYHQFPADSLTSGKHLFHVIPFTAAKIWEQANELTFEIWVDIDPPVIADMVPSSGSLVASEKVLVSCSLSDLDSGLDANTIILTVNNNTASFKYDAEKKLLQSDGEVNLQEGQNSVFVKACDKLGNCLTKAWTFSVDTSAPEGKILINAGAATTYSAYVNVNVVAAEEVTGMRYIYLSNDGVFDLEIAKPFTYKPVVQNWLLADPDVDGKKKVYAIFEDNAGNRSPIFSASINLKLMTPDTRIVSGPEPLTESNEAVFTFEASKPGCLFSYKFDNQDWSAWSDSEQAVFSGLSDGNQYFYVKSGFDANSDGDITLDEQDPTPATWVWTIGRGEYLEKLRKTLFWKR